MLLVMSLRNYGAETMIREDYTLRGSEFDPIEFLESMIYDTWTEETFTSLFHAIEGVVDCVYQGVHVGAPPIGDQALEALTELWRKHMPLLARTALRARRYDRGSRHMEQWFADAMPTRGGPTDDPPGSSEAEPPTPRGELNTFEEIYTQAFDDADLWVEELVWDVDGRSIRIRDEQRHRAIADWRVVDEIIRAHEPDNR